LVEQLIRTLGNMFEKKKLNEELSPVENLLLRQLKADKLLRKVVDPSADFSVLNLEGYVPPKLEIDLCFSAVTGREPGKGQSLRTSLDTIFRALECAEDLTRLLHTN
jgi:hypothetical protein